MRDKREKKTHSFYFPEDLIKEIKETAASLDRSESWVMAKAWNLSKEKLSQMAKAAENLEGDTAMKLSI